MASITLGIGTSFISGSDSALLYDTLLQLNRSKEYVKLEGRFYAIGNFAEAIAGVTGGLLAAQFTLLFPFYCQAVVSILGIIAAVTLIEPERTQTFSKHSNSSRVF